MAASAVGAGVGQAVGNAIGTSFGTDAFGQFARGAVSSFAAGTAAAAMRGGKIAIQQVATDAFGHAFGESVASANSSIGEQAYGMTAGEAEERSAAREVYGQQFQQASGVSIPGIVDGTGDHVVLRNMPANQWTSSLPNVNADFMGPRLSNDDASNLLDTLGLNRQTYNDGLGVQMARANVVNGRIQIAPDDGGVPSVSLPNNVGAKGFSPSDFSFHTYDVVTPSGLTDVKAIGQGIANYPTPGGGYTASPLGTINNAGEIPTAGYINFVRSYSMPTPDASRYTDITVKYTIQGQHGLEEGFVLRYGTVGANGEITVRSYGEGNNWRQNPILKPIWGSQVDKVLQGNQQDIIRKAK